MAIPCTHVTHENTVLCFTPQCLRKQAPCSRVWFIIFPTLFYRATPMVSYLLYFAPFFVLLVWQDWDLVSTYPNAFRTLVPVFTKYTDAAFPTDEPVDTTSRVALRYSLIWATADTIYM